MADRIFGQFQKGVSGNPAGRPKKHDVTAVEAEQWAELMASGDLPGLIRFFGKKASDKSDLFNMTVKLIQFILPKKQSVQANVVRDSTLTVRFLTDEEASREDYAAGGLFDAKLQDGSFQVDSGPVKVSGKKKPLPRK